MTEQTATPTHLSAQQLARVEALHEARKAMTSRSFAGSGPVDALSLMRVARFIETGSDDLLSVNYENDEDTD